MKATSLLIIFFAFFSLFSFGQRVYYVQDIAYNSEASDYNTGTDTLHPWATWQKAFNTAQAGDTVYFRGGTWYPTKGQDVYDANVVKINPLEGIGHNGTYDSPVCFFAYPPDVKKGKMPVLDCSLVHPVAGSRSGMKIGGGTYQKFSGLTVTNVRSWPGENEMWCAGIMITDVGVLSLERMTVSYSGGVGLMARGFDTLYMRNCDSHNNCDTLDSMMPGGDGDGFNIGSGGEIEDVYRIAYISGNRAWANSDDGFDIAAAKQLDIHDNWSIDNGRLEGDATGFKMSYSHIQDPEARKVYHNITAHNGRFGFTDLNLNYIIGPFMVYYNNGSFSDYSGFGSGVGDFFCDQGPASVIYRNDLVYQNSGTYQAAFRACWYEFPIYVIQDHNTWVQTTSHYYTAINPDYNVDNSDFVSLDTTGMLGSRQKDGSLPLTNFLRLKSTSDLVDGGIDVGFSYNGDAPDVGPYENDTVPGSKNLYPDVSITFPPDKHIFSHNYFTLSADASDDGEIDNVTFYYNDTIYIGSVYSAPWSFYWDNAPFGSYTLRAVATDTDGAASTSERIKISVTPPVKKVEGNTDVTGIIFPNPNDGSFIVYFNNPLKKTCDIEVFSIDGKKVYKDVVQEGEIIKEVFLPDNIIQGVYVLVLYAPEIFFTALFSKL